MKKLIAMLLVLLFVAGCTTYHKVTDINTGKNYYTKKIDYKASGAIALKDEKTGTRIVLSSSQVEKISRSQYNRGIRETDVE